MEDFLILQKMGNGISIGSSPRSETTAKLIGIDGELKEFFYPIKISNLLTTTTTTSESFICNSDKMEFDEFLSAMNGEEELQPGQLYFELPLTQLTRQLQAVDMCALALKASAALGMKDDVRCGCYNGVIIRKWVKVPLVFSNEDFGRLNGSEDLSLDGPACDVRFLLKKKAANLGVIPEE